MDSILDGISRMKRGWMESAGVRGGLESAGDGRDVGSLEKRGVLDAAGVGDGWTQSK